MLLCLHICHASFPYIFHRDRVFHIQKFCTIQLSNAIIRQVRNDIDTHKQVQC
ncbi:hypothetical protein F383_22185 [Gossypium arboreum]|uniref:Uncharacterized protein n=1 Tax=Gossypium arboreum TaxID=29729 RepID=A0A0B0NZ95_GOSAR|nr:hypothetical protein F383_22185 [Gossypium arboreum]